MNTSPYLTPQQSAAPLAYLFREGDRAVEIIATSFAEAMAALPARVAKAYPGHKSDYWQAFTYCGTLPV